MPAVKVKTDFPALTTLGSQKAGWKIDVNGYYAIGSGPAQTHKFKDNNIYKITNYIEDSDIAVITLEADKLPDEDIANYIADECGVKPENLTILVAPTSSLVGSIQISGRALETGIYKMYEIMNFDVTKITYAAGITLLHQLILIVLKLWVKLMMLSCLVEEHIIILNLMKVKI